MNLTEANDPNVIMSQHVIDMTYTATRCIVCFGTWPCLPYRLAAALAEAQREVDVATAMLDADVERLGGAWDRVEAYLNGWIESDAQRLPASVALKGVRAALFGERAADQPRLHTHERFRGDCSMPNCSEPVSEGGLCINHYADERSGKGGA